MQLKGFRQLRNFNFAKQKKFSCQLGQSKHFKNKAHPLVKTFHFCWTKENEYAQNKQSHKKMTKFNSIKEVIPTPSTE